MTSTLLWGVVVALGPECWEELAVGKWGPGKGDIPGRGDGDE